ncbi:MAG: hypothetical protein R6V31_11955 [Halohasta sp.]
MVDNNGAEHEITIEKATNEIVYHQCAAYADKPRDRTPNENEYNEQARRYAKYYVYQEHGYDTVDHAENPEYVDAVREAIADLSEAEFEQYFGPLHQQLRSHHDPSVDRLVDLPAGVQAEDAVVYELDVSLGVDLEADALSETAAAIADARGLDFEAATDRPVTEISQADLADWEAVGEAVVDRVDPETVPVDVAAVSGIHVGYPNALGEHEVQRADSPLNRQPDATIELLPADPGPLSEFRNYLDHHLRCQVRDCFAGMGLLAPDPFQTVGFGKFIYARRYDHYDLYPEFHTANTDGGGLFG